MSFVDFNAVFFPEKKWANVRLSNNSPCNACHIYEEYKITALYGNIAERQYAQLPESCNTCIKRLNWFIDCLAKLKWYEDRDERLKNRG